MCFALLCFIARLSHNLPAYYVAFGPHGPRKPTSNPGDGLKIVGSVGLAVVAAGLVFFGIRSQGEQTTVSEESTVFSLVGFLPVPAFVNSAPFRVSFFLRLSSTSTAQDYQQGVGGGHEPTCPRAEDGSHHRSVFVIQPPSP